MIKAKPRVVGGYIYRSSLEAKWAIFFERSGIKFKYEYKTFKTDHGYYLPDFYLPDFDVWIEIKPPTKIKELEYLKIQSVADQTNRICFVFCGFPRVLRDHSEPYLSGASSILVRPFGKMNSNIQVNVISDYFSENYCVFNDVDISNQDIHATNLSEIMTIYLADKGIIDRYEIHEKENNKDMDITGWLNDELIGAVKQYEKQNKAIHTDNIRNGSEHDKPNG